MLLRETFATGSYGGLGCAVLLRHSWLGLPPRTSRIVGLSGRTAQRERPRAMCPQHAIENDAVAIVLERKDEPPGQRAVQERGPDTPGALRITTVRPSRHVNRASQPRQNASFLWTVSSWMCTTFHRIAAAWEFLQPPSLGPIEQSPG